MYDPNQKCESDDWRLIDGAVEPPDGAGVAGFVGEAFMRWSQQARHRFSKTGKRARRALVCAIDKLESRQLFSGETVSTISPILASVSNPSSNSITLNQFFTDSDLPGTVVTFKTNVGTITVSLTDAATPLTVANFLSYVNSGAYNDTIFHRSALLSSSGGGGSPKAPADIIQGGGYKLQGTTFTHIPTSTPVNDEYTTATLNDSSGTLAMAKTAEANSATSEWYFNVHDNQSALDTPTTDSNGVATSYTAFGKVLTGMNIIGEIAGLPTYNASGSNSALGTLPVLGLSAARATVGAPITAANLIYTQSITAQPGVNYTVTSNNNALVTPKITNGVLSFIYASGASGSADITVTGKSLDGTSASTTFAVTVPNSTTPSAGPTTASITAPDVVTGTTADLSVLGSDTDSVSALNPATVTIVTQPADGTATVDTTDGHIKYTPNAGFIGADSLTYSVSDSAGSVSAAATVTLNVVAAPVTVSLGTSTARSLTFTQPNGVIGKLTVKRGSALVTFANSAVTTTTAGGVVTASGTGATIASIVITNTGAAASVSLMSTGAVSVGSITDAKAISIINAPTTTLTGNSSFGSISQLTLAGASDANLSLGSGTPIVSITNLMNTTVTDTGAIKSITATQWQSSGGGYYTLTAPSVGKLDVSGTFADVLNLSSTTTAINSSTIGQAGAAWTVAGSIGTAAFGTPGSTFSLTAAGTIGRLSIAGNLANSISASTFGSFTVSGTTTGATLNTTSGTAPLQFGKLVLGGAVSTTTITTTTGSIASLSAASLTTTQITSGSIGTLRVSGATTGSTITTNADFAENQVNIGRLIFGGTVNTSVITAAGNVGSIKAASLVSSHIFAGVSSTLTTTPALPSSTDDFAVDAKIGAVSLGKAAGAFSNSLIIAEVLGNLHLASITNSNGGVAQGVGADRIGALSATLVSGGTLKLGPSQLKSATVLVKYITAKKLTLDDFNITLV